MSGVEARRIQPEQVSLNCAGPVADHFAGLPGYHQLETGFVFFDRDVVRQGLAQREAGQHHLGHLVPGFIHAAAVDTVNFETLEYDLVPVDTGSGR